MTDAASISRALKGARTGDGYLVRCPVATHGQGKGDRRPSLSIRDGDDDRLLVCCHAGCDARDVLDALRRRGLLEDRDPSPTREARPARRREAVEPIEPDQRALALWRSAEPINGTKAHQYLHDRGITIDIPQSLRFIPHADYMPGYTFPAMVAALQSHDRRIIAVQTTFLDPRGDRKAQVREPRRTYGKMHNGAVRLGPAGDTLGLSEGIETALSAMQLTGLPVWCALGAGRMHNITLPDTVQELHIFADNDDAGRAAIERILAVHYRRRVIVHRPAPPNKDFNDALIALTRKERVA